jgi:hypothetical protein
MNGFLLGGFLWGGRELFFWFDIEFWFRWLFLVIGGIVIYFYSIIKLWFGGYSLLVFGVSLFW